MKWKGGMKVKTQLNIYFFFRFPEVMQIYFERFGDSDGTLAAGANPGWYPDIDKSRSSLSNSQNFPNVQKTASQHSFHQNNQNTSSRHSSNQNYQDNNDQESLHKKSLDRLSQQYELKLNDLELKNLKLEQDLMKQLNGIFKLFCFYSISRK
jgi:hypothetical protein